MIFGAMPFITYLLTCDKDAAQIVMLREYLV